MQLVVAVGEQTFLGWQKRLGYNLNCQIKGYVCVCVCVVASGLSSPEELASMPAPKVKATGGKTKADFVEISPEILRDNL